MSKFEKQILSIDPTRRLKIARGKLRRITDLVLEVVALNETNAIVVYSDTLTKQIPRSYAAFAFNQFQSALHQHEILKLASLWEAPDSEKYCLPAVISLIESNGVLDLIYRDVSHWHGAPAEDLSPSEDPRQNALKDVAIKQFQAEMSAEDLSKAKVELPKLITQAKEIYKSAKLNAILNLRDKHIAHALSETRREKKGTITPIKYGDEKEILETTISLVEGLYLWVSGTSFDMVDESRSIARKRAKELWNHCKFEIPE